MGQHGANLILLIINNCIRCCQLSIFTTCLGMSSTSSLRIPALRVRVACIPNSALSFTSMAVPMPAETLLLSAVHPSTHNCNGSTSDSSQWSIAAQQLELDRSDKHPMAMIVPGLRLQLHCAGVRDRPAYSHIMSFSVPLVSRLQPCSPHRR